MAEKDDYLLDILSDLGFVTPDQVAKAREEATAANVGVVDFSGQAPVVYATTTEGYGSSVNSNRVVRILDNETTAAVVTIAQATSTNIAFRGIEFTPENGSPKVSEK